MEHHFYTPEIITPELSSSSEEEEEEEKKPAPRRKSNFDYLSSKNEQQVLSEMIQEKVSAAKQEIVEQCRAERIEEEVTRQVKQKIQLECFIQMLREATSDEHPLTTTIRVPDAVDRPYRPRPMAKGCKKCPTPCHFLSQLMELGRYGDLEQEIELYPTHVRGSHLPSNKAPLLSLLVDKGTDRICPLPLLRRLLEAGAIVNATMPDGSSLLSALLREPQLYLLENHIMALLLFGTPVREKERSIIVALAQEASPPPPHHVLNILKQGALRRLKEVFLQWPDVDSDSIIVSPQQLRLREAFLYHEKTGDWEPDDFLLHGVNFYSLCHWSGVVDESGQEIMSEMEEVD